MPFSRPPSPTLHFAELTSTTFPPIEIVLALFLVVRLLTIHFVVVVVAAEMKRKMMKPPDPQGFDFDLDSDYDDGIGEEFWKTQ